MPFVAYICIYVPAEYSVHGIPKAIFRGKRLYMHWKPPSVFSLFVLHCFIRGDVFDSRILKHFSKAAVHHLLCLLFFVLPPIYLSFLQAGAVMVTSE